MKYILLIGAVLLLFACKKGESGYTYRYTLYHNSTGANFGYLDAAGGWHYRAAPNTFDTSFSSDTVIAKGKLQIGLVVQSASPEGDSNEVAIYRDGSRIAIARARGNVTVSNP